MNQPLAIRMNKKWRLVRHPGRSALELAAYIKEGRSLYDLPPVAQYLTEYGTWEPWGSFVQFLAREFQTEELALAYLTEPFGDLPEDGAMHSSRLTLTPDQIAAFHHDGYIVVPNLLDAVEIDLLRNIAKADHALQQDAGSRADGEGGAVKLVVRNDLPDDTIYGAIVRSRRIVDAMQQLLNDEVYHYHHKMILKEARVGGAWAWHQDYGYWYGNGCLFPDMGSCMIAVDRATKENGCLQVVKGSHNMGRIDHGKVGDQTGADPERVAACLQRLDLVYCELEPGSAIFFHGNTLHRSDQNKSEHPRWAFICCYNTKHNDPYKDSKHPRYSPLEIWDDQRIAEIGQEQWQGMR